jgi:phage terminase small subunit
MTKEEIIAILEKNMPDTGKRGILVQYADAYLEYQEATKNIEKNGLIVQHPRTSNPIENPYMAVRGRALKKLQMLPVLFADAEKI